MSKLFKELVDGDIVYVVEECNPDVVVECKINIKFEDLTSEYDDYIRNRYVGTLNSGKTKFKIHGYSGQVFRISTLYRKDGKKIPDKEFYNRAETGAIQGEKYMQYINSTHAVFGYNNFHMFTNIEDAKMFIVDYKLEDIKRELMKTIRVKKYKE